MVSSKKRREEALIKWRRRQVAEMWYSGEDVKTMAEKLKVSTDTIYNDQDYIEDHADNIMKGFIVKTIPNIINRSIYQINSANKIVSKIAKNEKTDDRLKVTAALAMAKTARDVVEIVAGNKSVIDMALGLDESLKGETIDELLLRDHTETETADKDPNRVF